ncbi:MAG: DUF294 nucleotidyltransferase-like domain-containing protein [archaeon]
MTLEGYLAVSTVKEMLTRPLITCNSDASIREALDIINTANVGSIVVVDTDNTPIGIVTAKDFARLMAAEEPSTPISKVMSAPIISVREDSTLFNAYRIQASKDVNHLVVVDELGKAKGIVTSRDLILGIEPSYAMVTLAGRISTAETPEQIRPLYDCIIRAITSMVNRGVGFFEVSEVITALNDVITVRIIELATDRLKENGEWRPVKYVWVVTGSGGRREQILGTDQDNAIIYDNTADQEDERFLTNLSNLVNDWLQVAGIPKCESGYIASNPEWGRPLSSWKRYFDDWIKDPVGPNVVRLSMFLDMRPVYGDRDLVLSLMEYAREKITTEALRSVNDVVFLRNPYIGFLGRLRYRNKRIDIKMSGLFPIIQFVKALAVQENITASSTLERLEHLVARYAIDVKTGEELREAFQFLSILRLKHQLRQIMANEKVDNDVIAGELTNFDEALLRASFQALEKIPLTLLARYGSHPMF